MTSIIYGLIDPRNNQLRYIGKTKDCVSRLKSHIRFAKKQKFTHCHVWLRQVMKENKLPELCVIEEVPENQSWQDAEKFWISYWKYLGANLTNIREGGDGPVNQYICSEETKQKIIQARTGKKFSLEAIESFKASWTPERRKKSGEEVRSRPPDSIATREKRRQSKLGTHLSEESKAKVKASWTPERKLRQVAWIKNINHKRFGTPL